jgi:hypothetical protein
MLVDILEESTPRARIYKEHPVPSKLEFGKSWVIDVCDLTHPRHPRYFEVESSMTKSTRNKQKAIAHHTGFDLFIISIKEMHNDLGKNPGICDIEKWLRERVI